MQKNDAKLLGELRERINAALKPLHPKKVILFGSYAWGRPTQESDVDLVVVLDSETVPSTYHEKMTNRLSVRRALDNVNRDYALDVLVYTAPEWKAFQDMGSAFSKEIISQGIEV